MAIYNADDLERFDTELGYLAGIIDGEGCLGLYKEKLKRPKKRKKSKEYSLRTRITIYNTNPQILQKCKEIINSFSGYKYTFLGEDKRGNRKKCFRIQVGGSIIPKLLELIQLYGKQKQQKLLIEAQSLISQHKPSHANNFTRLEEIYLELKELNKKGIK